MRFHQDDRAQRLIDIFPLEKGQINVHYFHSTEAICAWHRHQTQIDYFCCLKGSFKVGLCSEYDCVWWEYLSDKNFLILPIVQKVWHGYRALEPGSIMLYYLTEKYNSQDEEKVLPGHFGEDWGIISK